MKDMSQKIIGKIIDLTREIKLQKPERAKIAYVQEFFAYPPNSLPIGGMGVTFWYTKRAERLCHEIADIAMSYTPSLKTNDDAPLIEVIQTTLQKNILNQNVLVVVENR